MDIQSFLQSGLLESYVLNQCTPEERVEVERMAAAHPEVRTELQAIERTLEQVAFANAVPPPAGLKEQILQRVRAESGAPTIGTPRSRLLNVLPWATAALLALTLVVQVREKNKLNEQVAVLQTRLTDCESQTQQQARMQEIIALLRDRDTRTIILNDARGVDAKVAASVWHNPARAKTLLDINSLPFPPGGKHFQVWAIVDGKPVSMGMVNVRGNDGSWQELPFIQNAQAFAISAEDNPNGNPTPTVVVLVGKV